MINELYNNIRAFNTLVSLAKDGRFPHAILIEGENSEDKKDFAKRLTQAVFCRDNDNKPCGECIDCHKVITDNHPDILIYGQEGGNKSFHIDVIREIKMSACILPNEKEKKIYILTDAQNMTVQAQNALLKLIEEPPNHCIFILTCDNKSKLLTTIISRVMTISLEDNVSDISKAADDDALAVVTALCDRDIYSCMKILLKYEKSREEILILLGVIRQIIAQDITEFYLSDKMDRKFTALQGMKITDIIDEVEKYTVQNVNMALICTYIASQLKIALG